MKKLILLCAVLCTALIPTLAHAQTITQVVSQSGGEFDRNYWDYDCLLNAVIAAGLAETLNDTNLDVTVFAPNDAAFVRLARDFGYAGLDEGEAFQVIVDALTDLGDGDPIPLLRQILLYHVADGRRGIFDVILSREIKTLQGGTIRPRFIKILDNEPDLRNAKFFYPVNIKAENGNIHTINRILIPIDIPGN